MSDWVVVGAEVVERYNSSWRPTFSYGALKKIAKVYKTGNFVVEGSTQQWAVGYDGKHAVKTGGSARFSSSTDIVPYTAEVRADVERSNQYAAAVKVVEAEADRIRKLRHGRDVEETIAEAAKIESRS